jgi:hypothetical protein
VSHENKRAFRITLTSPPTINICPQHKFRNAASSFQK